MRPEAVKLQRLKKSNINLPKSKHRCANIRHRSCHIWELKSLQYIYSVARVVVWHYHSSRSSISIKLLLTLPYSIFMLFYPVVAIWGDGEMWTVCFIFFVKAILNCSIIVDFYCSAVPYLSPSLYLYMFGIIIDFLCYDL